MLFGFGCCEPHVLDCFGCDESDAFGTAENITLTCSGFSWTLPETSSTIEWLSFITHTIYANTTHGFHSINIANLNGGKQLRRNPSGACQWLWNEVLATESKWTFNFPPTLQETTYEPLNPSDPTSPWGRVLRTNAFPGCTPGRCYSVPWPFISAYLTIADTDEGYRLDLLVSFAVARTALPSAGTVGFTPYPGANATLLSQPTPAGYALQSPVATNPPTNTTGSTSIPPFRDGLETAGFFLNGGSLVRYQSEPIECMASFFANPITLTNTHTLDSQTTLWETTAPETVEVQF